MIFLIKFPLIPSRPLFRNFDGGYAHTHTHRHMHVYARTHIHINAVTVNIIKIMKHIGLTKTHYEVFDNEDDEAVLFYFNEHTEANKHQLLTNECLNIKSKDASEHDY